ncbi:MAG: DNA polymerase III subunit gamma/tau [Actinomycetota bacterium]|nr:DNA polymerase III subunit gamma/tau [Actinomycetota bacterium]
MAYLSLYRKYRPQTFDEILGQEHVSRTLAAAVRDDKVAHAYLFTGPRGTGKTSTARILAKAINCIHGPTPQPCGECDSCIAIADGSSLDVIEMDAASHSKVDETREILAGVPLATAGGRRKVYVIDEVHMLSAPSFNALLKTLEEPPPHVVFILATTEAHKVLATIVSRTQRFDFRRVPVDVLQHHIESVAKQESVDIDATAVEVIARHADGSVRDALSALDQLSTLEGHVGQDDAERVLGTRNEDSLTALFDAIAEGDVGQVFTALHTSIARGADVRQLALGVLDHARTLLILKAAPDAADLMDAAADDLATMGTQASRFAAGSLVRMIDLVAKALTEMRNAPNHRLLLEIALVRAASPDTDPSATGLLGRIERLERRIGIESDEHASVEAAPAPRQSHTPPAVRKKPAAKKTEGASAVADAVQAPEAATPSASRSAGVPAEIGLSHIRDAWSKTLAEVISRTRRVGAYLEGSRPVSFADGILTVATAADFHAEAMKDQSCTAVLGEGLYAALGIHAKFAFVPQSKAGTDSAAGGQLEKETEEVSVDDIVGDAEVQDPVELVKKGLGAEVVEEKVK